MRRLMAVMVSGFFMAACGLDLGDDDTTPPPDDETPLLVVLGACDKYDADACSTGCSTQYVNADAVELLRPSFVSSCVEEGGSVVEVCSTERAIGTCTVTSADAISEVVDSTHNASANCDEDPAEHQAFCEQSGGVWE